MKAYLVNIGSWLGGIILFIGIADLLLTEPQKNKFKAWGEHAWLWLEYQRAGKFLNLLRRKRFQQIFSLVIFSLILTASVLLFIVLMSVAAHMTRDDRLNLMAGMYGVGLIVSMILVAWKLHPKVISWVLKDDSVKSFLGRTLIITVIGLSLMLSFNYVVGLFERFFNPDEGIAYPAFLMISYLLFSPVTMETGLISTMLLLSLMWLLIVIVLMALFRIAQFFLIRIVEYPKGPLLGLSTLLVALAGLIKWFTG